MFGAFLLFFFQNFFYSPFFVFLEIYAEHMPQIPINETPDQPMVEKHPPEIDILIFLLCYTFYDIHLDKIVEIDGLESDFIYGNFSNSAYLIYEKTTETEKTYHIIPYSELK